MYICSSCGKILSDGVSICPECGASLKAPAHCTECGAKLQPNAKFCAECGTPAGQSG